MAASQASSGGLGDIPVLGGLVSSLANLTTECQILDSALNGTLINTLCGLAGAGSQIPVLGGLLLGNNGLLGQPISTLCPNGVGAATNPLSPILSGVGSIVGGLVGGLTGLTSAVNNLNTLERQAESEVRAMRADRSGRADETRPDQHGHRQRAVPVQRAADDGADHRQPGQRRRQLGLCRLLRHRIRPRQSGVARHLGLQQLPRARPIALQRALDPARLADRAQHRPGQRHPDQRPQRTDRARPAHDGLGQAAGQRGHRRRADHLGRRSGGDPGRRRRHHRRRRHLARGRDPGGRSGGDDEHRAGLDHGQLLGLGLVGRDGFGPLGDGRGGFGLVGGPSGACDDVVGHARRAGFVRGRVRLVRRSSLLDGLR